MALPQWLSRMTQDQRDAYFQKHPQSAHNPNRVAPDPYDDSVGDKIDRTFDKMHDKINKLTGGRVAKTGANMDKFKKGFEKFEEKFGKFKESKTGRLLRYLSPMLLTFSVEPNSNHNPRPRKTTMRHITLAATNRLRVSLPSTAQHRKLSRELAMPTVHKQGQKVNWRERGRAYEGKVVRYQKAKGSYPAFYVVDIGDYESKEVPAEIVFAN